MANNSQRRNNDDGVLSFMERLSPVVAIYRPTTASTSSDITSDPAPPSSSHILLHIFSNGGSSGAGSLYEQYAATATEGLDKQLPRHVTIFDSAPSTNFRMSKAVAFFAIGLSPIQRMVAAPFLYLAAAGWTLVLWLRLAADIQTRWGNHHNRPDLVLEAHGTYIYSGTDAMVHPDDVEQHAQEAEKAGYTVRKEEFVASAHVSHSRKDATRYWEVVTSTWDRNYPEN